jgi:hypothetical protein
VQRRPPAISKWRTPSRISLARWQRVGRAV